MKKILALLALGLIALTGCGNGEFNGWADDCNDMGGITSVTRYSYWGTPWYECFVDGEQVEVPGW